MNPKYIVVGVFSLGIFVVVYENVWTGSPREQNPHSVQVTPGEAGAALATVAVPGLSPKAEAGRIAFEANCATCHGVNAAGQDGTAPPLVHRIYEPNHHGDAAFQLAAKSGVRAHHWRFGNMPPVPGVSEQDVDKIIAYVRALQKANGIF